MNFAMPLLFWGAIVGPAIGAAVSYFSARNVNRSQQRYAERLSSTAHLREVGDLRSAGLNPILSAGGRGASTPSPKQNVPGERFGELAIQRSLAKATVGKLNAETESIKAEEIRREFSAKGLAADVEKKQTHAIFWRWLRGLIESGAGSSLAGTAQKLLKRFGGKAANATQKAIEDALDELERRKVDKRSVDAIRRGLRRGKGDN